MILSGRLYTARLDEMMPVRPTASHITWLEGDVPRLMVELNRFLAGEWPQGAKRWFIPACLPAFHFDYPRTKPNAVERSPTYVDSSEDILQRELNGAVAALAGDLA